MGLRVAPPACILICCRRQPIVEFPRLSCSLAFIAAVLWGAPNPRTGECLSTRPRVAPIPASSGCADGESSDRPEPSLRLRRQMADLQVSPALAPSGSPGWLVSGSPRIPPSGVAAFALPALPGSCIRGWVDDESQLNSNFASFG